jgi:tetratricopeptide (TPR) repeat protein
VDRPFAHYRSDATVLDGHLLITRELELRSASVAAGDADTAQSLLTQVREDQEQQFTLARVGEVNWKTWADSIPPQQLDALAYKAVFSNGEFGAALQLVERAAQANPKDPYAWGLKAVIQSLLGHDRAAKAAYAKQVDLQPDNTAARQALYNLMALTGEADRVIEEARARLRVNSQDSMALGSLQGASVVAKQWADAEQAAVRGLELQTDPLSQTLTKQGLSVYRACQDKSDNPGQEIEAALGPDPSPFELSLTVATLKDCRRHLDLASAYCNRLFALLEPSVPATTTSLSSLTEFPSLFAATLSQCGDVQIEMGEVDAGLERILAATRISPNNEIQKAAGKAFWDAGRTAEAEQLWGEAISLNPELLTDVPEAIRDSIRPARTDIVFPAWIPVPDATELVKDKVEPGDELFFLVRADEFGVVTRAFDLNIVPAASVQLALQGMRVPVIPLDGRSIPSVHVVMVRNTRGKVEVFRSFATATLNMVRSMRQDLFRPPQQAVR